MELEWSQKALKDLEKLQKRDQRYIIDSSSQKLSSNPLDQPKVSLISRENLQLFRLKLDGKDLNHRVFFDISEGKTVKVIGVFHRDEAYTDSSIRQLEKRKKD